MITDEQIAEAMKVLEFTAEDFAVTDRESLRALQSTARARYRKLVLELHPDKTGNDPEKTELFHAVSKVCDDIRDMRVPAGKAARRVKWAVNITASMER